MNLENMELLRLGDLASYINGRGFKPTEFVSKGFPIIRIANLNNSDAPFDYFDGDLDDGHLIHKGDILVSWSASLETYIWDKDLAALNQHIFKVVPKPELIDHEFLFFVLKYAMKGLREMVHGATMQHVTRPEFESYEVSIPINKETQRKIAENLKIQLSEVEAARNALECQKQEIVNLANAYIRESIEQPSKPVGAGLARDSDNVCDLNDVVTHSRARPAPTIGNTVIETRLGDVLEEVKQGIGPNWADFPVLGATRNGLAPAKEPPGKYPQRYKPVFSGTVFYNPMRIMIGSIAFVDDDDAPGITSPDYVALRGKAGVVDSRWFYYWLRSPYGVQCINSLARGAVRERMLFNRLAEGSILLPPYEEQLRVSKALAQLKSVKSGIQKQLNELNKIPERLLARAFGSNG